MRSVEQHLLETRVIEAGHRPFIWIERPETQHPPTIRLSQKLAAT
jgi:hypothetical protein